MSQSVPSMKEDPSLSKSLDEHLGEYEREFGLRLRRNGQWQRHPPSQGVSEVQFEQPGVHILTDFALYDECGRLVPVEILSLQGASGEITAFGTVINTADFILPPPAPFPRKEDALAKIVLLSQPPPSGLEFEYETMPSESPESKKVRRILDTLVFTPITRGALSSSQIGMQVQLLLKYPEFSRLALLVKQAWSDLLEQGGSDESTVKVDELSAMGKEIALYIQSHPRCSELDTEIKSTDAAVVVATTAASTSSASLTPVTKTPEEALRNIKRLKPVRKVDLEDLVPEYTWTANQCVEPNGPHEEKLVEMIDFLRNNLGKSNQELIGWKLLVSRKTNASHGDYDYTVFHSPSGVRFRSRTEVAKALKSTATTTATLSIVSASIPSTTTPSTAATTSSSTSVVPPPSSTTTTPPTCPDRPEYESFISPPPRLLAPDREESVLETIPSTSRTRVQLKPTGWSISHQGVFIFTATSVFVLLHPQEFYRVFFARAFLLHEASRLLDRIVNGSSSFSQQVCFVLQSARRVPGNQSAWFHIVPLASKRFFYYPLDDVLTFDFLCQHAQEFHFPTGDFSSQLLREQTYRSFRLKRMLSLALASDEEDKANHAKRLLQMEVRQRERIATIARRIELEAELPDDSLVDRLTLAELSQSTSRDALVHVALEKVLSKYAPIRKAIRPPPVLLTCDAAHFSGVGPLPASNARASANIVPHHVRSQHSWALLCGVLKETFPVCRPHPETHFGQIFSACLQIWEGSQLFAKRKGKAELSVSFMDLRKYLHGYTLNRNLSDVFVAMLRTISRDEFMKLPPVAVVGGSIGEEALQPGSEIASDSFAYDLTVWPMGNFAIDTFTWPRVLQTALEAHAMSNPDALMMEAFECNEWDGVTTSVFGKDVHDEFFKVESDELIGLCDDGLRRLMGDADFEDFFKADPVPNELVERPMDLGLIRKRIASGHYREVNASKGGDGDKKLVEVDLFEMYTQYRTGMQGFERKPECGKCRQCLERPRFGGFNLLSPSVCAARQYQLDMFNFAPPSAGNVQQRNVQKSRKRQFDLQLEESFRLLDEEYIAQDCRGMGHMGIAADVRWVFRNVRISHKGHSTLLKAGSRFEALFFGFYSRFVLPRDGTLVPKSKLVYSLPETMGRNALEYSPTRMETEEPVVPPRICEGFPSLLRVIQTWRTAGSWDALDVEMKVVALNWLVDRSLDSVMSSAGNAEESTVFADATHITGLSHDYCRLWCHPRLVKELGGLALVEDLKHPGKWSYYSSFQQIQEYLASLDPRGKREFVLKRTLDSQLDAIKSSFSQSIKDLVQAPVTLKTLELERNRLSKERHALEVQLPILKTQALRAKQQRKEEHEALEASRLAAFNKTRSQWREAKNAEGRPYYYLSSTRVPVWERPKELDQVFEPHAFDPKLSPSAEELALSQLEEKIESLLVQEEVSESKFELMEQFLKRDRLVLVGEEGLSKKKSTPVSLLFPSGIVPEKAHGNSQVVVNFVSHVLCVEHFTLGPDAERYLGVSEEWLLPESTVRTLWIQSMKDLVKQTVVLDSLKRLLIQLLRVVVGNDEEEEESTSLFFSKPVLQISFPEQWRFTCKVQTSQSIPEMAIYFAHLRKALGLNKNSLTARAQWERRMKKELMVH